MTNETKAAAESDKSADKKGRARRVCRTACTCAVRAAVWRAETHHRRLDRAQLPCVLEQRRRRTRRAGRPGEESRDGRHRPA